MYASICFRIVQAFCQAFPNLGCFCPRISKDSFGGFVGFQRVTREKIQSVLLQIFSPARASFWTHSRRRGAAFRRLAPSGVERAQPRDRERLGSTVAEGGFIVEHQYHSREV